MKWDVNTLQLSQLLGVSRVTLYNWRCQGMPHVRLSQHKIKYCLSDVIAWHNQYTKEKQQAWRDKYYKDFEY